MKPSRNPPAPPPLPPAPPEPPPPTTRYCTVPEKLGSKVPDEVYV